MTNVPIRDAATLILVRDRGDTPSILMGQRGAKAAFFPSKYVFPGGAVDAADDVPLGEDLAPACRDKLRDKSELSPNTIAAAAIRELWEETGQILGVKSDWPGAPEGWRGFAEAGYRPNGGALRFVFRAITPKGRPRRFDARFFIAHAEDLVTDPDDFSAAEDELSHLHWVPLSEARELDLPFITEVVLAEVSAYARGDHSTAGVPFFRGNDEELLIERLKQMAP